MRTMKYFWIKRWNLFWGFLATFPFPFLTYVWLSGRLAVNTESEMVNAWSNPGALSMPIAMSIIFFIFGFFSLLYVFLRCDLEEVLSEEGSVSE
jgi:hypothetical protein